MKTLISGHRKSKLINYDLMWIASTIDSIIVDTILDGSIIIGLSGMADGIDLLFCDLLLQNRMGYHCYIPFEGQDEYMSEQDKELRTRLIDKSWGILKVKNSQMVENCDSGIIVWDGNKGGTYNVFQQMVEKKKPFYWIEPINKQLTKINRAD